MTLKKILTMPLLTLCFSQGIAALEGEKATLHPLSQPGRISLTPAFTPDGTTAYFALSPCAEIGSCPQTMHVSRIKKGVWSKPKTLGLSMKGYNGNTARVDWPSVTPDGTTLLFSWSRERSEKLNEDVNEDFDLWGLNLTTPDPKPYPLQGERLNLTRGGRLGKIEYFYNETAPHLTDSGELYFWTQREGGVGGRDIYNAQPLADGTFSAPKILPAPINTVADDTIDWVSTDGKTMLLTRNGDIHRSVKVDGVWSEPKALGPSVNSPYADFASTVTPDGKTLIFSSTRPSPNNVAGLIQIWQTPYNN